MRALKFTKQKNKQNMETIKKQTKEQDFQFKIKKKKNC